MDEKRATEQEAEAIHNALVSFFAEIDSTLNTLDVIVHTRFEDDGRSEYMRFWTELRKAPVHIFCYGFLGLLDDFRNPPGLEIVCHVVQERSEEIAAARKLVLESKDSFGSTRDFWPRTENDAIAADGYVPCLLALCYNRMGELKEAHDDPHSAIYWYERALPPALKRLTIEGDDLEHAKTEVTKYYINLGLAMERAGRLSDAKDHYNDALTHLGVDFDALNHDTPLSIHICALNHVIKEWTGTSGRLTPGC